MKYLGFPLSPRLCRLLCGESPTHRAASAPLSLRGSAACCAVSLRLTGPPGMVIIGCVLVGAWFLVGPKQVTAAGQHGGKAEPKRIQFKRGTSSASVTDSVRGSEEAEYVVEARSGQTIYLEVDAVPKNSVVVSRVVQPGGGAIPLEKQGPGRWTAKLSEDSDYMVAITKEKPDRTRSRYKLIVRIR